MFTTLTKEGMPLLRYRTRDLCSLMPGECPCGRTNVRMTPIHGRSDDMLIIRGINVFPSQVESVVLSMEEFAPHYLLVVDRVKNLDTLQVQVELRQEYFTATLDTPAAIDELGKKLESKLRSVLSIGAHARAQPGQERTRHRQKKTEIISLHYDHTATDHFHREQHRHTLNGA